MSGDPAVRRCGVRRLMTAVNVYVRPSGYEECRACRIAARQRDPVGTPNYVARRVTCWPARTCASSGSGGGGAGSGRRRKRLGGPQEEDPRHGGPRVSMNSISQKGFDYEPG